MFRAWLEDTVTELELAWKQAETPEDAEQVLEELEQIQAMLAGAPVEVVDCEPPF